MKNTQGIVFLTIIIILFQMGCAAKYVPLTPSGGYEEEQLSEDEYIVRFIGNQHNTIDQVRIYLAYRCSELTLEQGYTHYLVLEDKSYLETNRQLASDDLDINITSSMSGGVNMEVRNTLGPQETIYAINGIFRLKMMHGPDPVHKTASIDAKKFIAQNQHLIKR